MRNWGLGKQCRRRPKSDAMSMLYVLFVGDTFPVVDGGRRLWWCWCGCVVRTVVLKTLPGWRGYAQTWKTNGRNPDCMVYKGRAGHHLNLSSQQLHLSMAGHEAMERAAKEHVHSLCRDVSPRSQDAGGSSRSFDSRQRQGLAQRGTSPVPFRGFGMLSRAQSFGVLRAPVATTCRQCIAR